VGWSSHGVPPYHCPAWSKSYRPSRIRPARLSGALPGSGGRRALDRARRGAASLRAAHEARRRGTTSSTASSISTDPLRRAGDVEDQRTTPRAGDAARQTTRAGSPMAHRLGEPGAHDGRGCGRCPPGSCRGGEPGAAGAHDQPVEAVGHVSERVRHGPRSRRRTRGAPSRGTRPRSGARRAPRHSVLAGAGHDAVGHREHLGLQRLAVWGRARDRRRHGNQLVGLATLPDRSPPDTRPGHRAAHAELRTAVPGTDAMPSVSSACGSRSAPLPHGGPRILRWGQRPRGPGGVSANRSSTTDRLGTRERAHAVDEQCRRARPGWPRIEKALTGGPQLVDIAAVEAPAGVGPTAQHAETRARGVDEHHDVGNTGTEGAVAGIGDDGQTPRSRGDQAAVRRWTPRDRPAAAAGRPRPRAPAPAIAVALPPGAAHRSTTRSPSVGAESSGDPLRGEVLDVAVVAGGDLGRPVHLSRASAAASSPRSARNRSTIQSGYAESVRRRGAVDRGLGDLAQHCVDQAPEALRRASTVAATAA
jgi:hypothetical protein